MPSSAKAEVEENAEPVPIEINHGYSRDYRPDLKQFTLAMMTSGDGDVQQFSFWKKAGDNLREKEELDLVIVLFTLTKFPS